MSNAEQIDTNDIQDILDGAESLATIDVGSSSQWGIADVSTPVGKLFHIVLPTTGGSRLKVSLLCELLAWKCYKHWLVGLKLESKIRN